VTDDVVDSPNAFVADHIRRFEATGGHPRPGVNDLLLTTRGRHSGKLRRTALVYARDGDRYVLAASNAGADRHPAWYLNLVADPRVVVRVGDRTFTATACTAMPGERPRLWDLMVATMPSYRGYQETTSREIPVVVLYGGR
jgi:deazaflavin-dependent oxidoreductase (nitroreductase family)